MKNRNKNMIDINNMAEVKNAQQEPTPKKKKNTSVKVIAAILIAAATIATGTAAFVACNQNLANEAKKAAITSNVDKSNRAAKNKAQPTTTTAKVKPTPIEKKQIVQKETKKSTQKATEKPAQKPTQAPAQKPTAAPTQAPAKVLMQAQKQAPTQAPTQSPVK